MHDPIAAVIRGATAGTIATLPMSVPMLAATRTGVMDRQPPEDITGAALREAGMPQPSTSRRALTAIAHLAFGAAAGAVYGLGIAALRGPVPDIRMAPGWVTGIPFALCVWAVSYLGWAPALGLVTSARDAPAGRNAVMVLAHVIFGAALGLIHRRLDVQRPISP